MHLEFATEPNYDYPEKLPLDLSDLKVNLIEERRFNIWAHDVSGMLNVNKMENIELDDGTPALRVLLTTDYELAEWGQPVEPLELIIKKKTAPAVTTNTDILLPERNTNVTHSVIWEDTSPVWDEYGHNRGTNALYAATLEFATEPNYDYPEPQDFPLDLRDLKINLIEHKTFSTVAFDVSGMLTVVDAGYVEDEKEGHAFYVDLGTDYQLKGWEKPIEPIRLLIPEHRLTAITIQKPTKRGDLTGDEKIDVSDAVLLCRYLVQDKKAAVSDAGLLNADCNGDGDITSDDVTKIMECIVNRRTEIE